MNLSALSHDRLVGECARSLDVFFRPRSVAVIGASTTPGKLGHTVVRNLVSGGFAGQVFAVNPSGVDIAGSLGVNSLAAIGKPVDLVFTAVPAGRVLAAVRDAAAAEARAVIIGASGFAELATDEGKALQEAVAAVARNVSMRVIGPNTNGLLDVHGALSLGYNASHAQRFKPGSVSVLSHSGALFDGIAKRLQSYGAGLSKFVAVGNELDVSLLDLLDYLVDDPTTEVIGLVLEGLSDGARLREIAHRLSLAGKRVVALKIGRSSEGANAALAHSSRLAGSGRAWLALLDACGFSTVHTVEALAGACAVLAGIREQPIAASGLLCITTSGAGGAILADLATDRGIPLAPQWNERKAASVIGKLPTAAKIRQPIDMGSLGDWSLLEPVLAALEAEHYDGPVVVYGHVAPAPGMAAHLAKALLSRRARYDRPLVMLSPGGLGTEVEARYVAAGIPVFHDSMTCFDSLAAYYKPGLGGATKPAVAAAAISGVDALLQRAGCGATLSELESAELLRLCGVPLVQSRVVHTAEDAMRQARELGYPLVLKALAPGVAHKHQAGLVAVGITSDDAFQSAFEVQTQRVDKLGGTGKTPFLLQPLIKGEIELIAGVSAESGLGHFLVWGLGGIHAEVFDQITLLAIPCTPHLLRSRVEASRTGHLLRAVDPSNVALVTFVAVLESLHALVLAHGQQLLSVDINPVLVSGTSVMAVDALVCTC